MVDMIKVKRKKEDHIIKVVDNLSNKKLEELLKQLSSDPQYQNNWVLIHKGSLQIIYYNQDLSKVKVAVEKALEEYEDAKFALAYFPRLH